MTLDKLNSHSLVQIFNRHQKQLNLLVVVLLSLYLIAFVAQLIWRIIPEPSLSATPTTSSRPPAQTAPSQSGVNLTRLQQLNLFGEVNAQIIVEAPPVTDAPETKLNLTLAGVVASTIQNAGAAIIENRGSQATYGLGEKIEGTNATLDQVLSDRVIIKNGTRHETLMLEGVDYNDPKRRQTQTASRSRPEPEPLRPARRLSEDAVEATEAIRRQPANFTDYFSISPKTQDGQLQGYQIKPGKDPALFESAGLVAGDVVVQINGYDLTDTQQSVDAMNELRNSQTIELTITREGEYLTIYLDIPVPDTE
ncbi:type II secretion system protein GspC [Alteromonas aestuariivivens]|uniref:Type II secretion system protein GspC n=1 Tax=Alteromonas aestuariivivens TaxID=1938339 RepID=A0A3D8M5M0_9ALTE|nr:type II secretion system protein GspC [Alteromonas aestuariivivens]RDV24880.1 type II secretion system protein GspC [Alteromonas aestuariivivens]